MSTRGLHKFQNASKCSETDCAHLMPQVIGSHYILKFCYANYFESMFRLLFVEKHPAKIASFNCRLQLRIYLYSKKMNDP